MRGITETSALTTGEQEHADGTFGDGLQTYTSGRVCIGMCERCN